LAPFDVTGQVISATMENDELMRAVAEGMAALRKTRERLKSNPHKPPDWEKITPETLKPAVEWSCIAVGTITEPVCCRRLGTWQW